MGKIREQYDKVEVDGDGQCLTSAADLILHPNVKVKMSAAQVRRRSLLFFQWLLVFWDRSSVGAAMVSIKRLRIYMHSGEENAAGSPGHLLASGDSAILPEQPIGVRARKMLKNDRGLT